MYIYVKVKTKAKVDGILETGPNRFMVSVRAVAERGEANKKVLELVASHLGRPLSAVRIFSGHTTPNKLLSIKD
ncbi:MAG: hypothetical protein A2571_03695 [Candidatus Vogelbacteria bacterium RIFOXYD1_FULL_44_32]|uniref:Uncharacterized protein n=1 Tax=Candidatus Vogelbacteria bacterium RIFOXYD1_FULL_44_32 TaxID=1802438 RepID=A0A1G2QC25_9BACT|nr:MAG: hypothetical protein A2571_03695 [Candidatus Vogelbacteria bacterium RIFOXYD1_FULL_44_32]